MFINPFLFLQNVYEYLFKKIKYKSNIGMASIKKINSEKKEKILLNLLKSQEESYNKGIFSS